MSKINRQGSNQSLSSSVEYHNFVFLAGLTADDLAKDIKGQTAEVLAKIDAALEANGTDKTRMLSAQIWLKDIRDRGAMNELWTAWLPAGGAPARGPARRLGLHGIMVRMVAIQAGFLSRSENAPGSAAVPC